MLKQISILLILRLKIAWADIKIIQQKEKKLLQFLLKDSLSDQNFLHNFEHH